MKTNLQFPNNTFIADHSDYSILAIYNSKSEDTVLLEYKHVISLVNFLRNNLNINERTVPVLFDTSLSIPDENFNIVCVDTSFRISIWDVGEVLFLLNFDQAKEFHDFLYEWLEIAKTLPE